MRNGVSCDGTPLTERKQFDREARNQIRRQLLDPYNRLHSIAEDIEFVKTIHQEYSSYPLIANLRCGAWYCDSRSVGGVTAHFKSADGHYNGWSFNLRRPNLHILSLVRDAGGVCLVDSTRSGKRMPDSLSKTVPIWCAVINRALRLRGSFPGESEDGQLHTPPQGVSKQEHAQINSRIGGWADGLAKSTYDLSSLDKPLRPVWITPATKALPVFDGNTPFLPVICISASRLVEHSSDRRQRGYCYVQGAGDDHENWSQALKPDIFWNHKDELLEALESDLPDVVRRLLAKISSASRPREVSPSLPTPISHIGGRLLISKLDELPREIATGNDGSMAGGLIPCVLVRPGATTPANTWTEYMKEKNLLHEVMIPTDKKSGERAFKANLSGCLDFIRKHLSHSRRVGIACASGKDLSVGIALVALQALFDDTGALDLERYERRKSEVSKESLRTRLQWVIASRPEADPSRATLKRINEFYMSPHVVR